MPASLLPMDRPSMLKGVETVRGGGVVVFPTDTVYGLGCDPFNAQAVKRLFEVKGRGAKPVSVLCASAAKAGELVRLNEEAARLAERHWPGPLTIVAPLRKPVPRELTQGNGTLGVRVPDSAKCLELITACGGWLTGTSANRSGEPSSRTARQALDRLGKRVDLVLDGGPSTGTESTVVQVVGDTVTILRTGPVGVGNEAKGRRTS